MNSTPSDGTHADMSTRELTQHLMELRLSSERQSKERHELNGAFHQGMGSLALQNQQISKALDALTDNVSEIKLAIAGNPALGQKGLAYVQERQGEQIEEGRRRLDEHDKQITRVKTIGSVLIFLAGAAAYFRDWFKG